MEEKVDNNRKLGAKYSSYSINFTWKIDNFLSITRDQWLYSDVFTGGDHKWMICIYPESGRYKDSNLLIYLVVAESGKLPNGWTRRVKCRLSVINKVDEHTIKQEFQLTFSASKNCGGFPSFIALNKLCRADQPFLVWGACTIRAEVWFNEEKEKEKPNKIEEKSVTNQAQCSSFSEFDIMFTEIQDRLKQKTTFNSFNVNDIEDAQTIFLSCLNMDLLSFIRSGKASVLKNSLSLLLTAKSFPDSVIDETAKFIANLDERCKKYTAAKRVLSEAQEAQESLEELQTTLKQLSSKFLLVRNQGEAIDNEIERLEELLDESKAKKARLRKRLDELAKQAATANQAMLSAEEHMKLTTTKKGEADTILSEFQSSWDSLKTLHSVDNGTPASQQPRNLRSRKRLHEE